MQWNSIHFNFFYFFSYADLQAASGVLIRQNNHTSPHLFHGPASKQHHLQRRLTPWRRAPQSVTRARTKPCPSYGSTTGHCCLCPPLCYASTTDGTPFLSYIMLLPQFMPQSLLLQLLLPPLRGSNAPATSVNTEGNFKS